MRVCDTEHLFTPYRHRLWGMVLQTMGPYRHRPWGMVPQTMDRTKSIELDSLELNPSITLNERRIDFRLLLFTIYITYDIILNIAILFSN